MKQIIFLVSVFLVVYVTAGADNITELKGSLGNGFIENKGQKPDLVRFDAPIASGNLFLTENAIYYNIVNQQDVANRYEYMHTHKLDKSAPVIHGHAIKVTFLGSNKNIEITGADLRSDIRNYYIGNDHLKWASACAVYDKIIYKNIYNNIDMEIYVNGVDYKYDFIVHAGGDPQDIQLQYEGADELQVTKQGDFLVKNTVSDIIEKKPYSWQTTIDNEIPCSFTLKNNILSFKVSRHYKANEDLVIDPTLIFATYTGTTGLISGDAATYDSQGNLYGSGGSFETGFPATTGAYQTSYTGAGAASEQWDMIITKYAAAGSTLMYGTYIAGTTEAVSNNFQTAQVDYPLSLYVDPSDNLYIFGTAGTTDFPIVAGCYQKKLGGCGDYAVCKLNPTGSSLLASTYLGGALDEGGAFQQKAASIFVDAANDVYVVGTTNSTDFPGIAGHYQSTLKGGYDGVVAKLNSGLTALTWATLIGGSEDDNVCDIKIASNGDIYVCGNTSSTDFPAVGGLHTTALGGTQDGFIAHINSAATSLLNSTYIGTAQNDKIKFIQLDNVNNAYVLGATTNSSYPTTAGVYSAPGAFNYYIHKLDPTLKTTAFSTCVGGNSNSNSSSIQGGVLDEFVPTAFGIDACQNLYFTGSVINSTGGFPTTANAYTKATKGLFICSLQRNAAALIYASYFGGATDSTNLYFGGSHFHQTSNCRYDQFGVLYHTECTVAANYPLLGKYSAKINGTSSNDAASFKFDFNFSVPLDSTRLGPDITVCPGSTVTPTLKTTTYPLTTTNYLYLWSTGATTPTITVSTSSAGKYWVRIYTSCDTVSDTLNVILKSPFSLTTGSQPAICGNKNGLAYVNVVGSSGGTPVYNWEPNLSTKDTLKAVAPGTYSVLVTINGCKDSTTAKVGVTGGITASAISRPATCGKNDGTAIASYSGIAGTPTYAWLPNLGTKDTLPNIPVGNYTVVVNVGGCVDTAKVMVAPNGSITATATSNPATCGQDNGMAIASYSGATGTPGYHWLPNLGTKDTLSNIPVGTYTVVVNIGTCVDTTKVTVAPNGSITASATSTPATCGQNNGTAVASYSGATGTPGYLWLPNLGNTATLANITVGTYTVVVNIGACVDTTKVTVAPNGSITASATSQPAVCGQSNGTATATYTGPAGTPGYHWLPNLDTTNTLANIPAGNYSVVVNIGTCVDTAKVTVAPIGSITALATSKPATCNQSNGTAIASYTGSINFSNVSYTWLPALGISSTLSNVSTGTYSIVVNANGCVDTTTVYVPTVGGVTVAVQQIINDSCYGSSNGSVLLHVQAGVRPLNFSWSSPINSSDSIATGLSAGGFSVTITDSAKCVTNLTGIITQPTKMQALISAGNDRCQKGIGSVSVTCSGGTPNYTYAWTGGGATSSIKNLQAGVYIVTVTDNNSCTIKDSGTVKNINDLITGNLAGTNVCLNKNTGYTVTIVDTSTTSNIAIINNLVWNFGDSTHLIGPSSLSHTYLKPGSFLISVTASDNYGCKTTLYDSVTVYPIPIINFTADTFNGCVPLSVNFVNTPESNTNYAWTLGDNTNSNSTQPSHSYNTVGTFNVGVTATSQFGCVNSQKITAMITTYGFPVADFTTKDFQVSEYEPTFQFINQSTNAYTNNWSFGDDSLNSTLINPKHTYAGPGEYNVCLLVTTEHGCKDNICKVVEVIPEWTFYIPNAFTPNGDGKNEIFYAYGTNISDVNLEIFDRWGELIFKGYGLTQGWDGKMYGGHYANGDILQQDVYVYKVSFNDLKGKKHSQSGQVSLIK
jgi:gliding motility-associated-like protein